jgi:hypothetical protein
MCTMAAKKKTTKRERLATLKAIQAEVARPGGDETYEQAAERAARCLHLLRERGFADIVDRSNPLTRFLSEHAAPVVIEQRPASHDELDRAEAVLSRRFPTSYRDFMVTRGGARFMRSNPSDGTYVFTIEESRTVADKLRDRLDEGLGRKRAEAPKPWKARDYRWLTREEASALSFWPVCPYYDGAFGLALGLADEQGRVPIFCWNNGADVMPYGMTMNEWFSEMVDWTITDMTSWVLANLSS